MSKVKNGAMRGSASQVSKVSALWRKAITYESSWDEKDDLLDVIYWMRQLFAVVNGIAWGIIPLEGLLGLAAFFVINCAIVYVYASKFQKVDEEEYGGVQEIVKEGLFTAFAAFLVSWIIAYTALYHPPKVL